MLTTSAIADNLPELGQFFPIDEGALHILTSPSQHNPSKQIEATGILFTVATDKDHKVNYIATNDPRFVSPEGLHIGSTLSQLLAMDMKHPVAEYGWAFHTRLNSGWSAAFFCGDNATNVPLQHDSTIAWFFKRAR